MKRVTLLAVLLLAASAKSGLSGWVPAYGNPGAPWRAGTAAITGSSDALVGGRPPKGGAIYDAAHTTVLYYRRGCGLSSIVLAYWIPRPPAGVASADLSGVRTARGVHLGDTSGEVARSYGAATPRGVSGHAGTTMLSYTTRIAGDGPEPGDCGQNENFVFHEARLIYIELASGCSP